MSDETFDPRFEALLRSSLRAEASKLPMTVTASQVVDRARARQAAHAGSLTGKLRLTGQRTRRQQLSMAFLAGAAAMAIVIAVVAGLNLLINQRGLIVGPPPSPTAVPSPTVRPSAEVAPSESPSNPSPVPVESSAVGPSADYGVFTSVAGQIVIEHASGIWGVDPTATYPAPIVQLTSTQGKPLAWSRDGQQLLLERNDQLFILHSDGAETQVTDQVPGFAGAALSPDGSRVVYAASSTPSHSCHGGVLYAVDADGGSPALLFGSQIPQDGLLTDPVFSPDGTEIAVHDGYCDQAHSVWVMNADGSDAHQIVTNDIGQPGHFYGLAWSPSGNRMALGFEQNLYTFATDGTNFRQIASDRTGDPYWSPDGAQIEYTARCRDGIGGAVRVGCIIAVANADGSDVRNLGFFDHSGPWHPGILATTVDPTSVPPAQPEPTPVQPSSRTDRPLGWSADGSSLLVQRDGENLFVVHSDGTETQVTHQLIVGGAPRGATISPDGTRVVFAGLTTKGTDWLSCHDGGLFAASADGGPAELLFRSAIPQNGLVRAPAFSPDGNLIAFTDGYCDWNHSLWVMNADGTNAHKVLSPDQAGFVLDVAWSPTGDRVALLYSGSEGGWLYAAAPDGSDFERGGTYSAFCWSGSYC